MAKLWDKGYELDKLAEEFTVGEDHILDQDLAVYDILGSIAHARMLASIGILSEAELASLKNALQSLLEQAEKGELKISLKQEDIHTAVEEALIEKTGDLGKKIHTGRSRNDQVILDLRLYMRDKLLAVQTAVAGCAGVLTVFAQKNEFVPMVGRTHTQRAMPSSVGTWAGAFAEALLDDITLLGTAYDMVDQCPLGSAASYGVKLPLDRQMVSDLLGFAKVQNNVLYVQNSRGKFEAVILAALSQITDDLARLAGDTIWFSTPEFGYFSLPDEYCPGSSIMPQKKNPGPLEIVRAKAALLASLVQRVSATIRALPSGYNRDLQETKGPLMRGFDTTLGCLAMITSIFGRLGVDEQKMKDSFSGEVFAADEANSLAAEGIPFRDAYKQVAANLASLGSQDPVENIKAKTHIGAPGALGLDTLAGAAADAASEAKVVKERLDGILKKL